MIGTDGNRVSGKSMLAAQLDDFEDAHYFNAFLLVVIYFIPILRRRLNIFTCYL